MTPSLAALKILGVAVLLCSAANFTNAQNLVVNGGFEDSTPGTGDANFPPGWNNVDPDMFSGIGDDSAFANSGNQYAFLGTESPNFGNLNQNLATIAGMSYVLTFFYASDGDAGGPAPDNSFEVFINAVSVFSMTDFLTAGYQQFSVGFVGASGTVVDFVYQNNVDFFRLDDVSVRAAGVPEMGSTLWLAFPAFAAFCLVHTLRGRTRKALSA